MTSAGTLDMPAISPMKRRLQARSWVLGLPREQRAQALIQQVTMDVDRERDDAASAVIARDIETEKARLRAMGISPPQPMMPQQQDFQGSTIGESIGGLLGGLGGGFSQSTANQAAISGARNEAAYGDAMMGYQQGMQNWNRQDQRLERDRSQSQRRIYGLEDELRGNQRQDQQNAVKEAKQRMASLQATADDLLGAMAVAKDPESLKLLSGRYNEIAQELGKAEADITGISEAIERRTREAKSNTDVDNYRQAFNVFTAYGGATPEQIESMNRERLRIKEVYGVEVPPVSDQRTVASGKDEKQLKAAWLKASTKRDGIIDAMAKAEAAGNQAAYDSLDRQLSMVDSEIRAIEAQFPSGTQDGVSPVRPNVPGITGAIGGAGRIPNRPPAKAKKSGGGGSGASGGGGGYSGLSEKQVNQRRNYFVDAKAKRDTALADYAKAMARMDIKAMEEAHTRVKHADTRLKELNAQMNARKKAPAKKQPSKPAPKATKGGNKWRIVG